MISLAVKYRPTEFEEVCGQAYTVKILENQINKNRIKHGYLFCGASGCGKTTIARIFANKINKGKGVPIEIDAASNGSIDNIRQLITEANFKSLDSSYKVYIIDECHSISNAAFQVFLKTLEEPPEYTIFILCTTDPQKVPITVQNRLQRFDFLRMDLGTIEKRLFYILEQEGLQDCIEKDAVSYIAKIAHGGMRDAITNLDKVLSLYRENFITEQDVLSILLLSDYDALLQIILNIGLSEANTLEVINKMFLQGKDLKLLLNQLIEFILEILKGCLIGLENTEIPTNLFNEVNKKIFSNSERCLYLKALLKRLLDLKYKIQYEGFVKPYIEAFIISEGNSGNR